MAEPSVDTIKEKRLQFYKATLNIMKGRRFSFEIEQQVDAAGDYILDGDNVTLDIVGRHVDAIHKIVSQIMIVRSSLDILTQNIIYHINSGTAKTRDEIEAVKTTSKMYKTIFPLIQDDEVDFYMLKMGQFEAFKKARERFEDQRKAFVAKNQKQEDTVRRISKARHLLRKVNTTRIMTRLLIGAFVNDHTAYPEINAFRTTLRWDLTLNDFLHTWDVGCESSNDITS